MPDEFLYDVFLSHSAKDTAVVREIARRLKEAGLRLWFDEWVLKAGDSIPAKIEEGLEHSRVLACPAEARRWRRTCPAVAHGRRRMLCMSANAFGSDWAQLAAGTCGRGNLPFRDPLNKERRFIPLRLDDASIKGSLAQFLYINWLPADRGQDIVTDSKSWKQLTAGYNELKLEVDAGNRFSTRMDTCVRRRGHYSEEQDTELAKWRKRLAALEKL